MSVVKTKDQSSKWFAIYVRSRAEKKVLDELTNEGIEAYLPLERKLRQWSDRKKMIETPLLPGYLFVKVRDSLKGKAEDRKKIKGARGFVLFVSHCGVEAVIPDHEIEALMTFTDQYIPGFDLEVTHEKLVNSKKVEILSGPFVGKTAQFVKIQGREMAGVILEEMNTSILFEIPFSEVAILE